MLTYRLIGLLFCLSFSLQAQEILTNQNIIAMDQAKASRRLIVEKINNSMGQFDMSVPGMLALKSVNIAEGIIEAMLAVTKPNDILTNENIIQLYNAGFSRKLITQRIQAGATQFNTSTDGVIQLKTAKVAEAIIKVMMTTSPATTPAVTPTTPTRLTPKVKQSSSAKKTAVSNVSTSDCKTWYDEFTKKTVKASMVTLRGKKLGATLLNATVGRGSANVFGIEDLEVSLIFRRDNENFTLVLYASKPGIHSLFVSSDKPLMFLLEDKSVMEFLPAEHSESDFSGSGYSLETEMLMYYTLNEAQAKTLTLTPIAKYRLNFYNRNYAEDTVNPNRAKQVQMAAACVLN
ncbi:hypothetical protein [Siphonobacter sp. SORGH_AS_1065]|uniref:hypothetical protein n=1 Tax=Siphonobacter sp. SORGH_AS_1065 TaxID=3041795 RepID=UPI00277EFB89|nr:hypothetical protein [Siphonobacter sp. SORGH_AS_1065]MDQ1089782.1 hypothetical protein [Siphonobacter sp. SORGH_AS_1065]